MAWQAQNHGLWLCGGILLGLALGTLAPPLPLHATATHGTSGPEEGIAICTAELEPGYEGIYYLDSRTGDLRAAFFNSLNNKINSIYSYNIRNDFKDASKTPKFLMVSGHTPLRPIGNISSSTGLIYIVEVNSGQMCVYSAPYGPNRASTTTDAKLVMVGSLKFGGQAVRDNK
jgi:hypothetical protein